jgi:hypothetical protein
MFDQNGQAVTETTTLGAAIVGKAACLGIHPNKVGTSALGVKFRRGRPSPANRLKPFWPTARSGGST